MIITLIFLVGLVIWAGLLILDVCCVIDLDDNLYESAVAFCVISVIGSITALLFVLSAHVGIDKSIEASRMDRQNIEAQIMVIKSDYEDISKTEVINRVYDWNKRVYEKKYWSENPWTSWFHSKHYVESLDYISIDFIRE